MGERLTRRQMQAKKRQLKVMESRVSSSTRDRDAIRGFTDVHNRYRKGIETVDGLEQAMKKESDQIQDLQKKLPTIQSKMDDVSNTRKQIAEMLDDAKNRWYRGDMGEMLTGMLPHSRLGRRMTGQEQQ